MQFKRAKYQNSNKLDFDKYYTDIKLAKYCINKTFEIIGEENITEIVEPAAGNGSFSLQIENCIAIDIDPEHDSIIKVDFLRQKFKYKKGRLIIGNPPFGSRNNLSVKFFKKSIKICDYISFILPISQLNNNSRLYDFDLIYSEDLKEKIYSNRKIKCCLNIYKRPKDGLNKKVKVKSDFIDIVEYRRGEKSNKNFDNSDLIICAWGNSIGKEVKVGKKFALEYHIFIKKREYKNKIIKLLKNANWVNEYQMTATPKINQWQVYDYLDRKLI